MSTKRNIAADMTNTKYLAFYDSDSFPANADVIENALNILDNNEEIYAVGGPDVSPPCQTYWNRIVGISTKSFLISGFRNYRKNITPEKFVNEL